MNQISKTTLPVERIHVAVNTVRARLTILGFNLAIITFQIANTRGLGGGTRVEGFETTVHLSTGLVLLIGLALSIAAMVVFTASSIFNREGTCDSRMLLTGDLLMYLALAQTVTGFFSSYERVLDVWTLSMNAEIGALSVVRNGIVVVGAAAWIMVAYVGPTVSLVRSHHSLRLKIFHSTAYLSILVYISHLWWAAQQIEGRVIAADGLLYKWFNALFAPIYW
jgi:hypothetical protein